MTQIRMGFRPFKDLKAVDFGHLQIEQHQNRQRIRLTVRMHALSREIRNGFLTITDDLQGICQACSFKSNLREQNVVGIVLGKQDCSSIHHLKINVPQLKAPARGMR